MISAFFFSLNMYIATFHSSPPHTFINDNGIPLHIKVELMTGAVKERRRLSNG